MNTSRLIGIILLVSGAVVTVLAGAWLANQTSAEGLSAGGAIVGAVIAFIPIALLFGFGIYLYVQGGRESERESAMHDQRRLLDIVRSRGQVQIHDLAIEMGVPVDSVQNMVHDLVGLQVFSGYVNWKDGTLYSAEASHLRDLEQCKNCGGEIQLAGKGVVTCRFCGTEYFLS